MRIVINGWFWDQPTVGSGQYVRQLVEHLAQVAPQHTYHVILPADAETRVLGKAATPAVIWHPVTVPFGKNKPRLRKLAFEQFTFPRFCDALRADVAHVPYWGSPLSSPCPVIVTIHDIIPLVLPAYRAQWTMRWYIRLVSLAARRADAIIAVSQATARAVMWRLHIPSDQVHVVYEGVSPDCRPLADASALDAVRRRYGLPEQFFLYLGGFDVRKNVGALLAAYDVLLRSATPNPPALVIAGRLPESDTAFLPDPRAQAEHLGITDRVHFPGQIDEADKPALFSLATALLFPSRYEGFGLPPLEAMACGCPVIASNATSLPEIVGEGGILVPPDDEPGWAAAMWRLLDATEHATWREKGLTQAARFSWVRAARETGAIYARVSSAREG